LIVRKKEKEKKDMVVMLVLMHIMLTSGRLIPSWAHAPSEG